MLQIKEQKNLRSGSPNSRLQFESDGWTRYLTIDGVRAYMIGGGCQTCGFLFERLGGANQTVEIEGTAKTLRHGVNSLDEDVVSVIGHGLPEDQYSLMLAEGCVTQVTPGRDNDYFAREQIALWGEDTFWCLPHDPRIAYFRAGDRDMGGRRRLFNFVVPMFPTKWLTMTTVAAYMKALEEKTSGTAVSIAVLDVRSPVEWVGDEPRDPAEHWCLTHYLLDGHHKLHAASKSGQPLRLLSFVSWSHGGSSREQIEEALSFMTPVNNQLP